MQFNPNDFFTSTQYRAGLLAVYGEASALLKLMQIDETLTAAQARFHCGRLAERPVVVAEIGQAKVHAASAAQILIDRFGANLLISCGSAGAIAPQQQVGDVVLASRVVPHDNGWHTSAGFVHLGVYNSAIPDGRHYRRDWPTDPLLLTAAQQAITTVDWPQAQPAVVSGTLVSGDQVIAATHQKEWLYHTFGAEAVEMEAAAIAQVATLNQCRWLAIRAISDSADSTLDIDVTQFITYDETPETFSDKVQQTSRNVGRLATDPRQAQAILRLRQGLKVAAHHAALAAAAVVQELP